jgi:hypothetical protein
MVHKKSEDAKLKDGSSMGDKKT